MAENRHSKVSLATELHVPKGFTEAAVDTVMVKRTGFIDPVWEPANNVAGPIGPVGPVGPVATVANVVIVQQTPATGQFATIEAALASITTASAVNPFVIHVGPGVFVENPLTMIPYVHLHGENTVITPVNPLVPLIIAAEGALIKHMEISGVTGAAAIDCNLSNPISFRLLDVTLTSNKIHVDVRTTTGTISEINLFQCRLEGASDIAIRVISGATVSAQADINESIIEQTQIGGMGVFLSGALSNIIINGGEVNGKLIGGSGIVIEDGGLLESFGTEIEQWGKGLVVNNVGVAPRLAMSSLLLDSNTIKDIEVLHIATFGSLNAVAQTSKVNIIDSAPVSVFILDPQVSGITTMGKFSIGKKQSQLVDASKLIHKGFKNGVLTGGVITSVTGLQISVSAGNGFFEQGIAPSDFLKEIFWATQNIILPDNSANYVYIDSTSTLVSSVIKPISKTNIMLGKVVTNAGIILFFDKSPFNIDHAGNDTENYLRDLGPIYSKGSLVTENITTPFKLDITAGVFRFGTTVVTPTGGAGLSFTSVFKNGLGAFSYLASFLVSKSWDDGSGVLAPIPAGSFAKHSLYCAGQGLDEKYFLVYSQTTFSSLVTVQGGDIPVPPSSFIEGIALIATIIVDAVGTNIVSIKDERPRIGFSATGVSASAVHGNLLGLNNTADHPYAVLIDGSRTMASLNVTTTITSAGLVNNRDMALDGAKLDSIVVADIRQPTALETKNAYESNANTNAFTDADLVKLNAPVTASTVNYAEIVGSPLTVQDQHNYMSSVGVLSGFTFTNNLDGTIAIGLGEAFIKALNTPTSNFLLVNSPALATLTLVNLSRNYIYLNYNAGTPNITAVISKFADTSTHILLGSVYKNGLVLEIDASDRSHVSQAAHLSSQRLLETAPTPLEFVQDPLAGILSSNIALANSISITPSSWWNGLERFTVPTFDSSGLDTFDTFLLGVGLVPTWTKSIAPVSALDIINYRSPLTGLLVALSVPVVAPAIQTLPAYSTRWVYQSSEGRVAVVYGEGYTSTSSAKNAQRPSILPPELFNYELISAVVVSTAGIVSHNRLIGLKDSGYFKESSLLVNLSIIGIAVDILDMKVTPKSGSYVAIFTASVDDSAGRIDSKYQFATSTALTPLVLTPEGAGSIVTVTRALSPVGVTLVKKMVFDGTDTLHITGTYLDTQGRGPSITSVGSRSLILIKIA